MKRFSRDYTRLCGFFYTADSGGGSGGGQPLTLKQQLDAAILERDQAKGALSIADGEKAGLQSKLTAAEGQVVTLKGEKDGLQMKLTAAEGEVTKLKGEAATADQRAIEIAAANGVPPKTKSDETVQGGAADGKALFATYQGLMQDEPAQASAFWDKHSKALLTYAETAEARGN